MTEQEQAQASRVANITAIIGKAAAQERLAGLAWYASFGKAISEYGVERGLTAQQSLALFALLSPRSRIKRNWANFRAVVDTHESAKAGCITGAMRRKVQGVLDGSMPIAEAVKGDKVSSFYANLAGDLQPVTIDRHAIAAAEGQVPLTLKISATAYHGYEQAYQAAALVLGIQPAQAQAIAWIVWRRLKGIEDVGGMGLIG